jgi:MobA/VirD2-like, nuclease domain/Large polyvalent protein-associated domain 7/TraI-like middle domain/RepB DNA-primase C-terminal helical domain
VIVKKVPTSKRGAQKNKALNVRALLDYIAGPKSGGDGEKVEHRGAENLLNLDHAAQVQEMVDLAQVARRCPQPVQHWIISWREGEQPTAAQADAALATFLGEMDLADHQVIYALHRDTRNCHLHLAVNRVHPESEKLVVVNKGFDHEVAHRAIARIERDQGWQREGRALFVARPDGHLERSRPRGQGGRQPSGPARDFEERVGERSAQRIAFEVAAPIIREAQSWREMHEALAREGIRFERKGSGAVLWIGDEPVKASSAGRDCSMSALEKRFGELARDLEQVAHDLPARTAEPVDRATSHWQTYAEGRARHLEERAAHRARSRDRQRDEWRRIAARHRRERDDIFNGSWRGRGDLLNATRSQLAAQQAREKADLRDQQKLERARLQQEHARFTGFKEWLAQKTPELAQQWRYRERRPPTIEGPTFERPVTRDIRAFEAIVDGRIVHYRLAGSQGSPAFTDRGKAIVIGDSRRREAVLAALQLSAQKWGTFTVHGDQRFQQLCVELALEHRFKIANPGLQQAIAGPRGRLRVEHEYEPIYRPVATSIAEAYRLHFADVARKTADGGTEASRLDAQVAVRLRLTGHDRDSIARVIKDTAPTLRPGEHRDWNNYARRAVDFAFGLPGSRLARRIARWRDHYLRGEELSLEGERYVARARPGPVHSVRGRSRGPFG